MSNKFQNLITSNSKIFKYILFQNLIFDFKLNNDNKITTTTTTTFL